MFRMASRTLGQFIDLLAALIRTSAKTVRKSLYMVVLIGLLGLNIASLTFSGLNLLLSGAIDTVGQFATIKSKSVRSQLDADVKVRNKRIETLNADVKARNKRIETLDADVKAGNKRIKMLDGEISKLKTSPNAKQLEKFDSITNNVIRRTRKTASRNIGSLAFESIPVIGAVVMVSVIVLEMNDICQTMKDVEDLRKEFGVEPVDENNQEKLCGFKVPQLSDVVGETGAQFFCRWFKDERDPLDYPDFDMENLQTLCKETPPDISPPGKSTSAGNKNVPDDISIPEIER